MQEPLNPSASSGEPAPSDADKAAAQDFLIQEHTTIEADTQRLRQEGQPDSISSSPLLAAVAVAIVTVVTSNSLTTAAKEAIGYGALTSVLIYTLLCYYYFIGREINTYRNFRAASRIRRYYVDLYPHVQKYLTLGITDVPAHQLNPRKNNSFSSTPFATSPRSRSRRARHRPCLGRADASGLHTRGGRSYVLSTLALWGWSAYKFNKETRSEESDIRFRYPPPKGASRG